jgi:DNA-binding winged helix-turn-helix (wHTH) protein
MRGGGPVALTAREYVVLEFLAMHRGEVVTRTALYEHLFDEDDATLSNILNVHIFNLRKELGHDFIVTRRGHGVAEGLARFTAAAAEANAKLGLARAATPPSLPTRAPRLTHKRTRRATGACFRKSSRARRG